MHVNFKGVHQMNIKKVITVGFMAVAASAMALDYCEVTGVNARQRYPWNGLVDIDFTLDSKATEPYLMHVTVLDNVGKTNLPVKTVYAENVSQKANPCMVTKDTTRIVWDAAADLPDGFKCTNVLVTCQDTRCVPTNNLYCVIDISAGSNASSYPVSYLDSVPAGGWSDEYKTTKIVLRRIEKGYFMMGSVDTELGRSNNEDRHKVTLTKPFYIGVFEVTEKQWNLVYGESGSSKKAKFATYAKIRGADCSGSGYNGSFKKESYCYPDSTAIDANSFIGKLKTKTGLGGLEMPTEAQWEYACKAGCDIGVNIGYECTAATVNLAARNKNNANDGRGDASSTGVTYVGCYMPNAWGLYDMLGNAVEWCRDSYADNLGTANKTDPTGAAATVYSRVNVFPSIGNIAYSGIKRVVKGGVFQQTTSHDWNYYSEYSLAYTSCRASYRSYLANGGSEESGMCGFRIVCNLSE